MKIFKTKTKKNYHDEASAKRSPSVTNRRSLTFRFGKRFALISIVFVLIFSFSVALAHHPAGVGGLYDKELLELNASIAKLEQEVLIQRTGAKSLEEQIVLIENQVKLLELKIEVLQKEIALLEQEIKTAQREIDLTKKKIERKKQLVKEYIREIHKNDDIPLIEVLVNSKELSDFMATNSTLLTVEYSVHNAVVDLKKLQTVLDNNLEILAIQKQNIIAKELEFLEKRRAFEDEKLSKNKLLEETKGAENAYQSKLNEEQNKRRELFKLIVSEGGGETKYVSAGKTPIFDFPLRKGYITQGYGYTQFAKEGNYGGGIHNGVDMATSAGEPLRAIADGVVYEKGAELCGPGCRSAYGNWVVLRHTYNSEDGKSTITYYSFYGHMQTSSISSGNVKAGDVVGYVGSTGFSSGPHVHFTIFRVICPNVDTSCDSSLPMSSTGPKWYSTNTVDPFDFMNTPPEDIFCGGYSDWDNAYKHHDQCHAN